MSLHESLVRLRHMLDHAREAVAMASGRSRDDLDNDRKLNLALVRLLEIVGEAASRTPADERSQYPQIPRKPWLRTLRVEPAKQGYSRSSLPFRGLSVF